jgi:Protein of unknown function (DUF2721)
MNNYFDVSDISQLISMAVAPVFLITGIGSLLNVLGSRLARIVDRARILSLKKSEGMASLRDVKELQVHVQRMNLAGWSIGLCVTSALLICSLVAILFLGGLLHFDPYEIIGVLFVLAMISLILGLILFLLEVRLAIQHNWVQSGFLRDARRTDDG